MTPSEGALRRWLAAVAVAGLAIALYLTVERAAGRAPACPIGGGCETVQSSRYAEIAGVPVAWLGLVAYAALLVAALLPGLPGRALGLFVATVGVGFSAWLTYAEVSLIHSLCAWCLASAALMTIALVVTALRAGAPEPAPSLSS